MKGKIIVVTGTDGSGKQTQAEKMFDLLKTKKYSVQKQSFPNYEKPCSGALKMYLNGDLCEKPEGMNAYQASTLFAVDRLCTMKGFEKFLSQGGILLLDRYMESNAIHQACKIEDADEKQKFINWLYDFEFNTLEIPKPDMVVFLDMPPKYSIELAHHRQCLKNGEKKDIHEQDDAYLTRAYNNGIGVAKQFGWTIIPCVENGKIKSIQQIHTEIAKVIAPILNDAKKQQHSLLK